VFFFLCQFLFLTLHFFFLHSSGTDSLSSEESANKNPLDSDNEGSKQTGHHYYDENSPISQSVPDLRASTSHTANTSEPAIPAIPTPFENEQKVRKKRKPGSGRPKGSKSTVAPEDRPHRLGRPPGTGRLQREGILPPEKRPREHPPKLQMLPTAASGDSRPFNLVSFFNSF
jgi:hypothetical protein